jgi:hypothetical protein
MTSIKSPTGKEMKIWGVTHGLIGDLVAGLPLLNYFEKKYPGSYKYWGIERKCAFTAPIFFNHPLIDRIKIGDNWGTPGDYDDRLRSECQIQLPQRGDELSHSSADWYNNYSMVEETAIARGIYDIKEILSEDEMKPQLYKWFDVGLPNPHAHTYTKEHRNDLSFYSNNIAIWPFSQGQTPGDGRNSGPGWWNNLIQVLVNEGFTVSHYGRSTDPTLSTLSHYKKMTHLSYLDAVKASLAAQVIIGTDSGAMWTFGAYSHPAIHLMTNWLPNHHQNFAALAPVNDKGTNLFIENRGPGWSQMNPKKVVEIVKTKIEQENQ